MKRIRDAGGNVATDEDGQGDAMARHGPVAKLAVSRLRSAVRPIAILVSDLFGGTSMRPTKLAIADGATGRRCAVAALVPDGQVFSVERSTIPALPSIEVIGVKSEASDYLIKHELIHRGHGESSDRGRRRRGCSMPSSRPHAPA